LVAVPAHWMKLGSSESFRLWTRAQSLGWFFRKETRPELNHWGKMGSGVEFPQKYRSLLGHARQGQRFVVSKPKQNPQFTLKRFVFALQLP
jgi:hypothetical protein